MNRSCFAPEEIGDLLDLEPGDPRHQHLEECPRCRARLESYRRFLNPPAGTHAADLADARIRLDAALAREIPGLGATVKPPAGRRAGRLPFPGLAAGWLPRPIPLAAGLLVVAGLLLLSGRLPFRREETGQMRGEKMDRPVSSGGLMAFPARSGPEGSLELRWRPVPGRGTYEVRLFSTDLRPRGAALTVQDTTLVLYPSKLEDPPSSGELLYWQVAAVSGGESVHSEVQVLQVP